MVTLESRNYGVARAIRRITGSWTIVNDVAGFIGPEVFRTPAQLFRACLEDTVMAKLQGITMGLDVCASFHMDISPASLQGLTDAITEAASPAYLMAIAGNADPMLALLTTSFRQHPHLRKLTGRRVTTRMQKRFTAMGIMDDSGELRAHRPGPESLYAAYLKQGGETRSLDALENEGRRRIRALAERGFDLGYGCAFDYSAPAEVKAGLDRVYAHAVRSLRAPMSETVKRRSSRRCCVRTAAADRTHYLAQPASGESLCTRDAARISALYPFKRPTVQIVVSDGLNADSVNENLSLVLPAVRSTLSGAGIPVGEIDIFITNGRVRAGYHIGSLLNVPVVIHFIGERPGTGLNTLSAYITYGRDAAGSPRWATGMDHACTSAVCGINRRGKHPGAAVEEIVHLVSRMLTEHRSGVSLGPATPLEHRPGRKPDR